MKRRLAMIFAAMFLATCVPHAWAETSKEETRLETGATDIDKDAGKPGSEKPVVQRIENEFKVTDAQIKDLRSRKLGYGEIAIVFALAQNMPGGITGANVDQIMKLRNGPPREGWGEVAKKLGFKLGPVVSKVEKVRKEERLEIKGERREKSERHEKIEKGERPESPERPEKVERPAMPERGGR